MTIVQSSAWLMLVLSGLWAGVILTFAIERTNLWARMPVEQYAVDFRRSVLRVDPMQPILAIVAIIATAVFAWHSDDSPRALAWIGVALIIVVVIGSIVIAEPINSKFRRIPEGQLPDRVEHHRTAWRHFHAGRTVVTLAAFACVAAAAVT